MNEEKVVDILSKTEPDIVAGRELARELARQVHAGEVRTVPLVISDHLDSREMVVGYIKEFLDEPSKEAEIDGMLKSVAQSKYLKSIL